MKRVIVIGLDGAEPSLVEPWMDQGRLPALAKLRDKGAYMRCRSTVPPATFPAWTTCVTGVNPGKHGIFDFTRICPGKYALQFMNATYRKAPALWNIHSAANRRVAVLGVPATYPPEPVNGLILAGFDSPVTTRVDRSFVYPREQYALVREWVFADFQESRIVDGWHSMALEKLLRGIHKKTAICLECLRQEPWDFFMVVFGESDTVAHHFWLFHDQHSPRHVANPELRDAILTVYEHLDMAVGQILNEGDDRETLVVVVSDHGFGGTGTGVIHINNYLHEKGFLSFAASRSSQWLKSIALAAIPSSLQGRIFRMCHQMAARTESQSRFRHIDWSKTLAWSEELNYFPSVWINLEGRQPCGQVRMSDYEKVRDDVIAALEAWFPVRKAWRREELYCGEWLQEAPDIVLELQTENGYSFSCLRSAPGGPSFRRISPHERFGGKERGMTGSHRPEGVLFLSEKACRFDASLEDIAPTVLDYLDVLLQPMDGTSLLGSAKSVNESVPFSASEITYTPEEERIIEERLRALGYWE